MTEHVALVRTRLTFERDRELQSESAIETTPRASIDQTSRWHAGIKFNLTYLCGIALSLTTPPMLFICARRRWLRNYSHELLQHSPSDILDTSFSNKTTSVVTNFFPGFPLTYPGFHVLRRQSPLNLFAFYLMHLAPWKYSRWDRLPAQPKHVPDCFLFA